MIIKKKEKIIFIVNPISGTSHKKLVLSQVEKLLDKSKFDYEICPTQYIGHATEITKQAVMQGVSIVCAVGGDGTVNEVARALVHTHTALAIIPCGSGNGLARHLHIPIDATRAIHLINNNKAKNIDYGRINLHPFFCTCGVGFDAFISRKFAESGKRGPLTYLENILRNGLNYNPETYDIEIEDEQAITSRHKAFVICCANASQYGNNVYIAPQASVRDGLLDVTIMEPFTAIDAPQVAIQMLNGTINKNSHIKTFKCKSLSIHRKQKGIIHYDGDPIETNADVDIAIIPAGLKCICPDEEGVFSPAQNMQNIIIEQFNAITSQVKNLKFINK